MLTFWLVATPFLALTVALHLPIRDRYRDHDRNSLD